MGGADKGLVAYRGRPLIEWAIDLVRPQVDRLFLSANRNLDRYASLGYPVLPDSLPDYPGPLAGVLAGLAATRADWLLIVPCDTPHLPADLGARLLAAARRENTALAVAAEAGRVHHGCFVVRRELRPSLAAYLQSGERAVRGWQAQHVPVTVEFDARHFVNFNHLVQIEAAQFENPDAPAATLIPSPKGQP